MGGSTTAPDCQRRTSPVMSETFVLMSQTAVDGVGRAVGHRRGAIRLALLFLLSLAGALSLFFSSLANEFFLDSAAP
jgi:hypothetical protein